MEDISRAVFALELVGSGELRPVLLGDQLLHLGPAQVDPVVEVPAPEHEVVRENGSALKNRQ